MFIGHFGLGFAAKRPAPATSLGALFFACQFADLLWPVLVQLGIERFEIRPGATVVTPFDFISYPYSHSLAALVGWGLLIGVLYAAIGRNLRRGGIVLGLLVVSHWFLDVVTHRPDMPLTPAADSARVGLGAWNSMAATLAIELPLYAAGVLLYVRTTKPRDRTGTVGLAGLVILLLVVYAGAILGPPPPSVAAVTWADDAMWLVPVWAYWVDRHRRSA
jgi:hypothetical protein